ncbi:hypothetical protein EYC87_05255 [Halieaceae bacterium IMCC8485]|uniref:ParB/Sulfiredoxin domain-containing protein n=1 Tax=Candidatus Seongchinamella marina TaxID=2518990 RepID=A0ABT3STM2_9GAMM|nr:hypothetical protein [Candidatus Seongchinamella marina]MCX2972991.1 hypothetical protein [Candidatus Seongchinamella marina]
MKNKLPAGYLNLGNSIMHFAQVRQYTADIERFKRHLPLMRELDGVEDGPEAIDGRNRLAACKLAKVEPEVKQLNGHDPEALILSENIMRRHMTKGQRAMAVAMMYPEGQQGKKDNIAKLLGSGEYLRQARTVLKYAPEYTDAVLAGAKSLSEAYEEAKHRKRAGNAIYERIDDIPQFALSLREFGALSIAEGEKLQQQLGGGCA